MSTDSIAVPNDDYKDMLPAWDLIDTLMGGTAAMKSARETYLPREEEEEIASYNARLERSVLFERLPSAVDSLSGRPFSKPVQLEGGDLPEPLDAIAEGVDDEGRDMTSFCHRLLEIALLRGFVHILVDYPAKTAESLAQERELGLRPMLLAIDPKDLIGWKYIKGANGKYDLTQIRIAENSFADKSGDLYAVEKRKRIRVIDVQSDSEWELYEETKSEDGKSTAWVKIDSGPWSVGKITLVTIYFRKTGFMKGKSPLESLAWLNFAHWQAMSDYLNNARFASARVYFGAGFTDEDIKKKLVVGANQKFFSQNPDSSLSIVESSGSTLSASESVLTKLEDQMDAVAKGPLIVKMSGNVTATGEAISEGKGQCELQAWVHLIEAGVGQAMYYAGEWVGIELPEDFGVNIYDDFGILERSAQDLDHIERARDRGDFDLVTYLESFKLRGLLPEDTDIDKMIDRIQQEGPGLGMLGREQVTEEQSQQAESPEGSQGEKGEQVTE